MGLQTVADSSLPVALRRGRPLGKPQKLEYIGIFDHTNRFDASDVSFRCLSHGVIGARHLLTDRRPRLSLRPQQHRRYVREERLFPLQLSHISIQPHSSKRARRIQVDGKRSRRASPETWCPERAPNSGRFPRLQTHPPIAAMIPVCLTFVAIITIENRLLSSFQKIFSTNIEHLLSF